MKRLTLTAIAALAISLQSTIVFAEHAACEDVEKLIQDLDDEGGVYLSAENYDFSNTALPKAVTRQAKALPIEEIESTAADYIKLWEEKDSSKFIDNTANLQMAFYNWTGDNC